MTREDMLRIALRQSAEEAGCLPGDFLSGRSRVVPLRMGPDARAYYRPPIACNFVSYGSCVVAAAQPELAELAEEYVGRFEFYRCFETPALDWLAGRLAEKGCKVCFMAEYWLPGEERIPVRGCAYALRLLGPADFAELYLPQWGNALCADRRALDVLGVGAYDGETLVGLAGCSADCADMWQIGIDVLPAYRRRGIASALTSRLAAEILGRGKVPFYCSAWSNLPSARNAVRSGFVPAWVEMTVKPAETVDVMNARSGGAPDGSGTPGRDRDA